ncbi:MAG: sortase, partial [Chloroflexia bacterium]
MKATTPEERSPRPQRPILWGLSNLLILAGLFLLLYVGGLYLFPLGRAALQPSPPPVRQAPALAVTPDPTPSPSPAATPVPTPTPSPALPMLNWSRPEVSPLPTSRPLWHSEVLRIVIPSIGVDSPVVAVGWHVEEVGGQTMTVWDVARYAVGHHQGSGNPGEGTNIVLAGHSGGYGGVFRRLVEVQPGDEVVLHTAAGQYLYVVEEVLVLKEVGLPMEERIQNARYMAPTDEERLTLITCWPVHIYDHRVIVLARPYRAAPFPRPDLQ